MSRESWLRSDDSDKFAEAAVKCQHAGGFCLDDGFCHFEGICFRTGYSAMRRACKLIELAASTEPKDIASELRLAAQLLDRAWKSQQEAIEDHDL
jgi:hypothetical protein